MSCKNSYRLVHFNCLFMSIHTLFYRCRCRGWLWECTHSCPKRFIGRHNRNSGCKWQLCIRWRTDDFERYRRTYNPIGHSMVDAYSFRGCCFGPRRYSTRLQPQVTLDHILTFPYTLSWEQRNLGILCVYSLIGFFSTIPSTNWFQNDFSIKFEWRTWNFFDEIFSKFDYYFERLIRWRRIKILVIHEKVIVLDVIETNLCN